MNNDSIGLCYYPTTTVFIDDNKGYLDYMKLNLADVIPCQFFDAPDVFLDHFKQNYQHKTFIDNCILNNTDHDSDENFSINFDINAIHQYVYNPNRFAEISTLVVDYSMPSMNGLELCQQIRQLNKEIRIIMLTGEADQTLAVNAFNAGLINKFIVKNNTDITRATLDSVLQQQQDYFLALSDSVLNKKTKQAKQILLSLDDPNFINLFVKIKQQHRIVEYYSVTNTGSLLMLDENAKPSWLAILSDDQMAAFYVTAEYGGSSQEILSALKDKKKIPFILSNEADYVLPNDWDDYFYPANLLKGQTDYYYAYITEHKNYLGNSKILSLKSYLDNIDFKN